MSWVRIDDGFDSHPKIRKLSLAATGLLVRGMAHSGQYLTDGVLDVEWINERARGRVGKNALRELQLAGLLEPCEGGALRIHDFLDYNPSRAEVEAQRRKNREKQRRHRDRPRLFDGRPLDGRNPVTNPSRGESGSGRGSTGPLEEGDDLTGARASSDECRAWVERHFPELTPTQREMVAVQLAWRTENGADCSVAAMRAWMAPIFGEAAA